MKTELTWLKTILIGGIIGFIVNFTWYFNNEWITLLLCLILYSLAGFLLQVKFHSVNTAKMIGTFWYIISILTFAAIVNYSNHLPILFTTAVCSFITGQLIGKARIKACS